MSNTMGRATVKDVKPDALTNGNKHLWKGYFAFEVRDLEKSKDGKVFIYNKEAKGIHRLMTGVRVVIVPQEDLEEFYELLKLSKVRRQFEVSAIWTQQAMPNRQLEWYGTHNSTFCWDFLNKGGNCEKY